MELENIYNIARKAGIDEKYIEPDMKLVIDTINAFENED